MVFEAEIKEGVLRINCLGSIYGTTLEDSEEVFSRVIDNLIKNPKVLSIILSETREYEYDYNQTKMLSEIADALITIVKGKKLTSIKNFPKHRLTPRWFNWVNSLVTVQLRKDPIGAYVSLIREIRHARVKASKAIGNEKEAYLQYLNNVLLPIKEVLDKCKLIQLSKPYLAGYHIGDRSLYREFFHPLIRPNFMFTKYLAQPPQGEMVERYRVGETEVEIFKVPGKSRFFYYVVPPEFKLSEDEYMLLDAARRILEERRPREFEIRDQKKLREVFTNIGFDLLRDLAEESGKAFSQTTLEKLTGILTRYTAGFGIIEILLEDERIQDIYINSPLGSSPVYIFHQDFEECETNLITTHMDGERWATRFRLLSGRPFDEANPVLDTELEVPGGKARVAFIRERLSPDGMALAIRRHRDKPWTYPLFLNVKYINPLFAGLMSFIIDYGRTFLIAGGRGSGKTSLLGASMLEILPRNRIITVEDSVTGDCRILIRRNGKIEKTTIGELIDNLIQKYKAEKKLGREIIKAKNIKDKIEVFSINKKGKVELKEVSAFIRHKTNKDIYEVVTATGRKIKVTGDHSLFSIGEKEVLKEVKVRELKEGDFIATPRLYKIDNKGIKSINLLEHLDKLKRFYLSGEEIKIFVKKEREKIKNIAKKQGYSEKLYSYWKRKGILPVKIFTELNKNKTIRLKNVKIKPKSGGQALPVEIELDEDFLTFIGLWIADGCYDKRSVLISVAEKELKKIVKRVAKKFNLKTKRHSDGFTEIINSTLLKKIMQEVLELKGNAYTKEIPSWVYNLSKKQIAYVLKGIFSGDGCVSEKEIVISLSSEKLLYDLQTLLLNYGIILRKSDKRGKDKTFNARISGSKFLKIFRDEIGFCVNKKKEKLEKLCSKVSSHKLNPLEQLADSDIFWDKVVKIRKLKSHNYVYDLSVPENENFICENILAHNTLELPVPALRELGYNIERLKSRSVITYVETELPAEEALRTSLRLGDSCLIIGEVRSTEAKALYEAMRVGAMANVVAGTIHGESAYGVFDRVVNDLGVPPTSFKATDLIVICKRLKSADGLHIYRRVVEVVEVRKHWKHDPLDENGFITLMQYSAKDDMLKPTQTLLNGESWILNQISREVREWAGNWSAVWENIQLRAKIAETMVEYAKKLGKSELLEARTRVKANEMFHMISERIKEEIGYIDTKRVFNEWKTWFEKEIKGL